MADNNSTSPDSAANGRHAFEVRLEVFEGPLDILLRLIERKQLEISKVSLALVADSFLHYMEAHPDMPAAPLASFVWVASKLLWIKSQALLPRPPVAREEDEEDPGDELVRRLEAYKRLQEVARWLRAREAGGLRSYERPAPLEAPGKPEPAPEEMGTGLEGVTLARLVRLVERRMQLALPIAPPPGTVLRGHTITVAEKVAHLRRRVNALADGVRLPLGDEFATAAARSRTELVVLFLAVLDIMRRGQAVAEQDELFGEIWLSKPAPTDLG